MVCTCTAAVKVAAVAHVDDSDGQEGDVGEGIPTRVDQDESERSAGRRKQSLSSRIYVLRSRQERPASSTHAVDLGKLVDWLSKHPPVSGIRPSDIHAGCVPDHESGAGVTVGPGDPLPSSPKKSPRQLWRSVL